MDKSRGGPPGEETTAWGRPSTSQAPNRHPPQAGQQLSLATSPGARASVTSQPFFPEPQDLVSLAGRLEVNGQGQWEEWGPWGGGGA